ncbi:MAG: hypothetical protein IPK35_18870 [Saprospiraceae bacterium]|jgi:hypothetical protein|nr:hypothetical protein [Saprospiraceae bacterium]
MKTITFFLICLGFQAQGQEFSIFNQTGKKKISHTDILDVYISKELPSKNICNYSLVTGRLISMVNDSITIDVTKIQVFSKEAAFQTQLSYDWQNQNYKKTFAKDDIALLKIIKSERKRKRNEAMSATGGLLLIGGALTALNTFIFVEKGHRKNLLIASGIQVVGGLVIGLSSTTKRYQFKGSQDNWQFGL